MLELSKDVSTLRNELQSVEEEIEAVIQELERRIALAPTQPAAPTEEAEAVTGAQSGSDGSSPAVTEESGDKEKKGIVAVRSDVDRVAHLNHFRASIDELLSTVEEAMSDTNSKYAEMSTFFGEDASQAATVLTTLNEFLDHFSVAKKAFMRKQRKRPL
jgi:hypothetical protein